MGRAAEDGFAFLAGDASADADEHARVVFFEGQSPSKVGEHLLLRSLAHGAGIEEHDVGFFSACGRTGLRSQRVRHAGGVILVHLASEGADEQFLLAHSLMIAELGRIRRSPAGNSEGHESFAPLLGGFRA